ncbi:hypothetical protein BDP55DRAFT_636700 [Colletotrichum godetiae]|uniref:Uncharacterized protein n=1 Tax=Colletotrichum godetiae TaxID=1209918 RepID=A0AAJ0ENE1_9PEZI|nr:uncharacterized protein BDP55DRAFT_636700 [Colletotrichum godetiae]KAK1659715.1 hypothetical protein BDP55DRAFT_636700 [Colletotrichum godetiae]
MEGFQGGLLYLVGRMTSVKEVREYRLDYDFLGHVEEQDVGSVDSIHTAEKTRFEMGMVTPGDQQYGDRRRRPEQTPADRREAWKATGMCAALVWKYGCVEPCSATDWEWRVFFTFSQTSSLVSTLAELPDRDSRLAARPFHFLALTPATERSNKTYGFIGLFARSSSHRCTDRGGGLGKLSNSYWEVETHSGSELKRPAHVNVVREPMGTLALRTWSLGGAMLVELGNDQRRWHARYRSNNFRPYFPCPGQPGTAHRGRLQAQRSEARAGL